MCHTKNNVVIITRYLRHCRVMLLVLTKYEEIIMLESLYYETNYRNIDSKLSCRN